MEKNISKFISDYPSVSDKNFSYQIAKRKEFYDLKLSPSEEIPHEQGIPLLSQEMVSRFFSPETDFKEGLLFHGMGTGKCVLPDTIVSTSEGEIQIGELWEKYSSVLEFEDGEGYWTEPSKYIYISSFDQKTFDVRPINNFYRQYVSEDIIHLTLDDGSSISVTQAHHLFNGKEWTNRFAEGDIVCVPEKIPRMKNCNWVTPELARWMGWQISEGHENSNTNAVIISQKDISVINSLAEEFKIISEEYDIKGVPKIYQGRIPYLQLHSSDWCKFLKKKGYVWGHKSVGKDIPDFIFGSNDNCVRMFLRAYFEGDGTVGKRQGRVSVTSASWNVITKLSTLLRRFGIWLRIRKIFKGDTKGKNIKKIYYKGSIPQEHSWLFAQVIGFESDRKQTKIRKPKNTNLLKIPCNSLLKEIREEMLLPYRKFIEHCYIYDKESPSRQKISRALDNLRTQPATIFQTQKIKQLENLLSRNLLYPRIKNIKIEKYEGWVYDLEILGTHNYVANNILCHNTCASSLIVENFKSTIVNDSKRKPAIILVPNEDLERSYRKSVAKQCTKEGIYLPEYTASELSKAKKGGTLKMTEMTHEKRLRAAISNSYEIWTYEKFLSSLPREELIRTKYSNRIIIIDEAHNLRIQPPKRKKSDAFSRMQGSEDTGVKLSLYKKMWDFLHSVENCRKILLSGTPIWDQVHEIAGLMNLILPKEEQLVTKNKFVKKYFDDDGTLRKEKLNSLKSIFRGRISYLRPMMTAAYRKEIGVRVPWLKYVHVFPSGMSQMQYEYAKESAEKINIVQFRRRTKEGKIITVNRKTQGGAVQILARDAATFIFPVFTQKEGKWKITGGSYGTSAFKKNIVSYNGGRNYKYANKKVAQEIKNNLYQYSSKFAAIIDLIKKHPNELVFIYDEFVASGGGGAINLALVLQEHGFLWAKSAKHIQKPSNKKRFAVITSDVATTHLSRQIQRFIDSFNRSDNKYGERCQIIIGSRKIAEGLTIKNVRQAHVVTPHWNIPAIDQALGRVFRVGSHDDLPEDERYINIYHHAAVKEYDEDREEYNKGEGFPEFMGFSEELTIDLSVYRIAEEKEHYNTQMYRFLRKIAWDCPLTYGRNVLKTDEDGNRACDYQECNYRCDGFSTKYINKEEKIWDYVIPNRDILKDNYNIFYSSKDVDEMVGKIRDLFKFYFNLKLDMIGQLIDVTTPEENDLMLRALDFIINARVQIQNRYGFGSYLKEQGNIYFLDNNISVFPDYSQNVYINYPIVSENINLGDFIESSQLGEDKYLVQKFCKSPKDQEKLLGEMHYKTLILLVEKIQELSVINPKDLTPRQKQAIKVITKSLGSNLINVKDDVVIHNMYAYEYTGLGYNVAVQEIKPTGLMRVFDPEKIEWRYTENVKEEEEYISLLQKRQKEQRGAVWLTNPVGVYGFRDIDGKFKIRVKPLPNKKETKGSVCIEASWPISRIYQLFKKLEIYPPPDKKIEDETREKLVRNIKAQPSLKIFAEDLDSLPTNKLKSIITLRSMNKKQLCETIEKWFQENGLFHDYRV